MVGLTCAEPPGSMLGPCHRVPIPADPFHHRSHKVKQKERQRQPNAHVGAQVGTEPSDFSLLTFSPLPFVAQVREMMGE